MGPNGSFSKKIRERLQTNALQYVVSVKLKLGQFSYYAPIPNKMEKL